MDIFFRISNSTEISITNTLVGAKTAIRKPIVEANHEAGCIFEINALALDVGTVIGIDLGINNLCVGIFKA